MRQGIFLPESASGADCLTVSVQPPCEIVCINICAHVKNVKHWQVFVVVLVLRISQVFVVVLVLRISQVFVVVLVLRISQVFVVVLVLRI